MIEIKQELFLIIQALIFKQDDRKANCLLPIIWNINEYYIMVLQLSHLYAI